MVHRFIVFLGLSGVLTGCGPECRRVADCAIGEVCAVGGICTPALAGSVACQSDQECGDPSVFRCSFGRCKVLSSAPVTPPTDGGPGDADAETGDADAETGDADTDAGIGDVGTSTGADAGP